MPPESLNISYRDIDRNDSVMDIHNQQFKIEIKSKSPKKKSITKSGSKDQS